jgi:hypothetical protein
MKTRDLTEVTANDKEKLALSAWGKPYIRVPRFLIDYVLRSDGVNQQAAILHLLLMSLCNFAASTTIINHKEVACKRGEYVGTYRELSGYLGLRYERIRRLLDKLVAQNWIEVTPMSKGIRIYLYGYDAFTRSSAQERKKKESVKVKTPEEAYAENVLKAQQGIFY